MRRCRQVLATLVILGALLCACGGGGSSSTSPAPPPDNTVTVSISASPSVINQGESATLTWTSTNATRVEIDGFPDATNPNGILVVNPQLTTTYSIRAYGVTTAEAVVGVTVISVIVPPPPLSKKVFWVAPQNFTDATPLVPTMDLQGFEIYIKQDPSFEPDDIPVATASPLEDAYDLSNVSPPLSKGVTYYISLRAVPVDGVKSDFSPATSFSIPQ